MLWSEKYRDEIVAARREGANAGSSRAYDAMSKLVACLKRDGKESDAILAMEDPEFRDDLMRRYGIEG